MKYAIVIPARYKSSRFPGKPLAKIQGKPMIQWVHEKCSEAIPLTDVYVATDSEAIKECVEGFGGKVIMTSEKCLTGTDRLAEAASSLNYDFFINVQGDEPLISANDINAVISFHKSNTGEIVNAYARIESECDFRSPSVPKVVMGEKNQLLYMSRAPIPTNKELGFDGANRQVCIYVFSREHLEFFSGFTEKTPMESKEDIEILRFLESGYNVKMVEVASQSVAVDYPEDIVRVEKILLESN